jgi:DNA polymerase III subunit epsilon
MKREIVLDTETTGLDPASGHRIVEIGCVEVVGAIRTGNFFHTYLNPERDMPDEAFRVHGLSGQFLKDKPVFAEKVEEFLEFLADSQLVIHNAGFDMRFINAELATLGFKPIPMERTLDTVILAKKKFPGSPASLDALCKRFEIDLSARTKHGALLDAELLADVYLELLGGRQVMLSLDSAATRQQQQEVAGSGEQQKQFLEARVFAPSSEELEAHEAMLARLKNPLWKNSQAS